MAIRVEASRFAVLKVEDDDDDDSDEKKQKPTTTKGNQPTETKKKAKKKKKEDNSGSKKISKKSEVSDNQWDQWLQKNDENIDKEFEKQLSDALLQSKLEYEERQQVEAAIVGGEAKSGDLKKNKKKSRQDAVNSVFADSSQKRPIAVSEDTSITKTPVEAQGDAAGSKDKSAQQTKSQEFPKKNIVKDYKAAILEKEEQIKDLREHNRKIEAEVADIKKRNQQFCLMLGRGEMMDLASIKAELEELQLVRDNLTLEVAQCSSELEKERSKSHALKAERDKLKMIRLGGK